MKKKGTGKWMLILSSIVLYFALLVLVSRVQGGAALGAAPVAVLGAGVLVLLSLFASKRRKWVGTERYATNNSSYAQEEPNEGEGKHGDNVLYRYDNFRKDILCAAILTICLFVTMSYFLGFAKSGLDAPYSYGGDGILELGDCKRQLAGEQRKTDSLGAPFVSTYEDFPNYFLSNFDIFLKRIIGLFTQDPVVVTNLFFLLIYPLCGVSSYFVLRTLKIDRAISTFGAVVFALAPYIAARNISHIVLAACFFVPLSILLCVWTALGEEDYLKFGKGFFKDKRNTATILFALLIANNGVGYYPIFTCFFLCVVALFRLISERNWRSLKQPLIVISMIACFFLLEVMPCVLNQIQHGTMVQRSFVESEINGLKIVQMFIPLNTHGIQPLTNLVDAYNSQAPLVNENATAYLGVCALIGFLISLCAMFLPRKSSEKNWVWQIQLFSLLNVCAILFATIGGLSTLFSAIFHMMRAFNRISIYILFISVAVLCICLQRFRLKCKTPIRKLAYWSCFILLISICLFDQLPTWGANDGRLEADKATYQSDGHFISEIEAQLQPGDMVYQLPYHKFPEAGPVNGMEDYYLYIGYIHSKNLKWSYGGMKGRESDQWHERAATLPMDDLLQVIVPAGFRGIYIDTRAYTSEDLEKLKAGVEASIQAQPIASESGSLLFYNLYPYLAEHPELSQHHICSVEEIEQLRMKIPVGESVAFDGSEKDAHRYFTSGISGTEDHFAWTDGKEARFVTYIDGDIRGDLVMELNFQWTFNGPQRMIVTCGGQTLYDEVQTDASSPAVIPIPTTYIQDKKLDLVFHFPNAVTPKSVGVNDDERELALALTSLKISCAQEP